jgi:hypothetical protein
MRRILLASVAGLLAMAGCDARGAGPADVDLRELGVQASARVGVPHPGEVPQSATLLSGAVVAGPSGSLDPIEAGVYDVGVACAGVGQLSVEWLVTSGSDASFGALAVPCGDAGVFTTDLTVETSGNLQITVRGDDAAVGRAAYAILVTPPRVGAAEALLGPADEGMVSGGSGGSGGTTSMEGQYGAGSYRLRVACVGVGTLRVSIDGTAAGIFPEPRDLTCTPQGAVVDLEASTSDALTITIGDAPWTTGFASHAYRLSRFVAG